jgi:hypothetical protein
VKGLPVPELKSELVAQLSRRLGNVVVHEALIAAGYLTTEGLFTAMSPLEEFLLEGFVILQLRLQQLNAK